MAATKTNKRKSASKAKSSAHRQYFYFFGNGKADGDASMRDLLGGKGANLAEMVNAKIPVPTGFTITTDACRLFYDSGMELPKGFDEEMMVQVAALEKATKLTFGDTNNPLLVSVRSGSKFSMPGMMDTILNLGLNDDTVAGLAAKTKNERFALDNYRRFIQMFGNVVLGIDKDLFEDVITKKKKDRKIKQDSSLQVVDLKDIVKKYKAIVQKKTGESFPEDPMIQLQMARDAVFRSWNNPRAITYRRLHDIPSEIGTAVNVQAMVFGNMGNTSATGVGFTRDPGTGANEFYGEYLINAQGEDVVAGIRTPKPIKDLAKEMPKAFKQLRDITARLEKHYRDIQDFEFTVQEGELFMLQTRNGKRTVQAAVKIAVDMVHEKLITKEEALMRIEPESIDQLLHPQLDPKAKYEVIAKGLAASPGAASGAVFFTADDVVNQSSKVATILVREETNPDDIEGMNVAQGILTSRGGMTSHAAVVARGMGKCCVTGAEQILVNTAKKYFQVGKLQIKEGETITLNGSTGEVIVGTVDTIEPELSDEFTELMSWADDFRTLGIRANADIPRDAAKAVEFGAEGIGLCRTEHMFFAEDRVPIVQQMILADSPADRQAALDKLLPMQKKDFKGLLDAMEGLPVTIRTLDPPLHEFLPREEEVKAKLDGLDPRSDTYEEDLEELQHTLKRVQELAEANPMLGHRGCRLGIFFPEITEMQVRAIITAALELAKAGKKALPEIMIPLVGHVNELKHQKEVVERVAAEVLSRTKITDLEFLIGTMIEIPRAAVVADQIAEEADFFSFGTNDLTQMGMGFSRDDVGKFLGGYIENGILPGDPFVSIDQEGIGKFVSMAFETGRATKPTLKVGVCGEHGGDPKSIEFFNALGLNYVSCSPFRVPIARLAAAQAALRQGTPATGKAKVVKAAKKVTRKTAKKATAKKTATKQTTKKAAVKKTPTKKAAKKTVKKAAKKKSGSRK